MFYWHVYLAMQVTMYLKYTQWFYQHDQCSAGRQQYFMRPAFYEHDMQINWRKEGSLQLGLCATLLAPSSIDDWGTIKGSRYLAFAQSSSRVQPSIPLPLVTLSSSSVWG